LDKKLLLKLFAAKIEQMRQLLTAAALEAHAAATHAESKAEDKYDTRGLEASYLAGAQANRALELERMSNVYRFIDLKDFGPDSPIAATAVVELQSEDGRRALYFLMPNGGGMSVDWEGKRVQSITPQSPMGEALLGKKQGDEISVVVAGRESDFEITSVI